MVAVSHGIELPVDVHMKEAEAEYAKLRLQKWNRSGQMS